jgi:predicted ArsR family transcriptional regulator
MATHDPRPTNVSPSLSPTEFGSVVTAITSAFGDPTRRAIYLHVHEQPDGVTASAVATRFELHANVARHHLDKLTAGGYLEVSTGRPPGGAGRPSKVFSAAAPFIRLDVPVGHDEVITRLLGRALDELGPERASELAEEVGIELGQSLAQALGSSAEGQTSFRNSLHAVADALAAHGFGAHAEDGASGSAIVTDHCPFGEVAIQNPVICAVDRGMVKGMFGRLYGGETAVEMRSRRSEGDEVCVTAVDP